MKRLELEVRRPAGTEPLVLAVRRLINAGFVGRDQEAVRRHIEELSREGVAPPPSVPVLYPIFAENVTTAGYIEVIEARTSGEAEVALIQSGAKIYVGVGSDHTDRSLEALSVVKSKQMCPNVLSSGVWDYADVRDHWDQLRLRSQVRPGPRQEWLPYQGADLASVLSGDRILDLIRARLREPGIDGTVIFCGTVPILADAIVYGSEFRCELLDPVLGRSLHCQYEVRRLDYLQEESPNGPL